MTNEEWKVASERTLADLKQRDKNALKFIMESAEGRWFIGRLLDNCHIFTPMNEKQLEISEGERRIGLIIRHNIMSMSDGLVLYHKLEEEKAMVEALHEQIREEVHKEFEGGYYNE